jgi:BMFP domain-containing protein YqiC
MKNPDFLKDLSERLCETIPLGFKNAKKDIEKNFHAVLKNFFNKLDLVTREEYEAQTKVLARTRKKIDALETEVAELEKILLKNKE